MTQSSTAAASPGVNSVSFSTNTLPSRQVGSWELVGRTGEGKLSEVFRARPHQARAGSSANYAVKVLRKEWEDDPRAQVFLRREAHLGYRVSHPNLISVLAYNVESAPYYVVMPLLDGATLASRLAADWKPRLSVALWIARQTAQALDALHQCTEVSESGVCHGDVKPSNIFMAPDGHVTLLDLGFAQGGGKDGSLADRPIVGTVAYMAPEMITPSRASDIRSDIFSLGATLFEMLTGSLPFNNNNSTKLVIPQRDVAAKTLCSLVPQVPQPVVNLVLEMLANEPLRRPQTPRELVDRLVPLEIKFFDESPTDGRQTGGRQTG